MLEHCNRALLKGLDRLLPMVLFTKGFGDKYSGQNPHPPQTIVRGSTIGSEKENHLGTNNIQVRRLKCSGV